MEPIPDLQHFPGPPPEFASALERMHVTLEPHELERLRQFLWLLADCNTRFNLTAVTEPSQMWLKHVQDSLTLLPLLSGADKSGARLSACDVGSGGGVPGIVLAVVLPACDFTLMESTGKKARFIEDAARELGLSNVRVSHQRAEEAGQDHKLMREKFDVVIARAVAPMNVLLELCLPLVRQGGSFITIKGERASDELALCGRAFGELRARLVSAERSETGTIVVMEKTGKTPRIYPRLPGEPGRRPL
ncbi:MAG: 16S rRNA (guanine(527)-N(7))-methyltransferase RsmG [Phycisphaerales bacterium]|nr:16S rRNA (guanine(527)-N(7))-methyltransferase RsmG [Phycisphaerales bacterium]